MEHFGAHRLNGIPKLLKRWSGRWESNPRRPAWEAGILPLNYSRTLQVITNTTLTRQQLGVAQRDRAFPRSECSSLGEHDTLAFLPPVCKLLLEYDSMAWSRREP